jgi:hypothetical protein
VRPPDPSLPPEKRPSSWPTVAILAGLILLLLLALLGLVAQFIRPFRTRNEWILAFINVYDGSALLERSHEKPWSASQNKKGPRVRDLWCCGDWLLLREWDWERDGVYDCRDTYCEPPSTRNFCVYYRRQEEWVLTPPEVTGCEQLQPR